jgi:hypothetical protein
MTEWNQFTKNIEVGKMKTQVLKKKDVKVGMKVQDTWFIEYGKVVKIVTRGIYVKFNVVPDFLENNIKGKIAFYDNVHISFLEKVR